MKNIMYVDESLALISLMYEFEIQNYNWAIENKKWSFIGNKSYFFDEGIAIINNYTITIFLLGIAEELKNIGVN